MIDRLDELFRVRTASGLPETRMTREEAESATPGSETLNAMDLIFENIARKNLSWDTILSEKSYTIPVPGYSGLFTTDASFFTPLVPALASIPLPSPIGLPSPTPTSQQFFTARFDKDDPRIAGAVTTARFFGRYSTTNLNRSRGRAAALFRIFLCDDMRASVEPKAEEEAELLQKAFPPEKHAFAVHRSPPQLDEDPHGADPACMACHYKLDPMGRTFFNVSVALSEEPSPGALVYRRDDASLVNLAARGTGDIAKALLAQPEYQRCQVTHFWKWFLRADVPPTTARFQEVAREFEKVGHRANDFIAYLVNQPEFYTDATPSSGTSFLDVKPLLTRCTSCHSGLPEHPVPSFASVPIGGDATTHREQLRLISKKLDLAHDGKKRTMPPKNSAWQVTAEEIAKVKAWIADGARDEANAPTITAEEASAILRPVMTDGAAAGAAGFQGTFTRYAGGHDLFRLLAQRFPRANVPKLGDCGTLTDKNRAVLGDLNPSTGEPTYRGPSSAFVRWYSKCLVTIVDKHVGAAYPPRYEPWMQLTPEKRTEITRELVRSYLGTGTGLSEEGFAKRLETALASSTKALSVNDAVKKLLFYIGMQDQFLTY